MNLIAEARRASGLSQSELAQRAATSRPTLSAYERGRKSPNLATAQRIVRAAGSDLVLTERPTFSVRFTNRGAPFFVPDRLPRLRVADALARVELPSTVSWSDPNPIFDLSLRSERFLAYPLLLAEGSGGDIARAVDGVLLAEIWPELRLPAEIRAAWQPLIERREEGPTARPGVRQARAGRDDRRTQ